MEEEKNKLNQDNITPTQKPEPSSDDKGAKAKRDFSGFMGSFRAFLVELLDIRENTDEENTKQSIVNDIPFKGHTSWILICSIFICSIGLNANSTAVVIGAMLISPLMGPILGVGMSVAINDVDLLRRSLKNFAVMVVLSILTAYVFFAIFPIQDESSELLARTAPDIRDVLIAFFGGMALVIARARKGTIASVIFGVAIATALMPPLCTVGFGLAIANFEYAGGAMYLFIINAIFIALATFVIIKILRFPMVRYANSKKRKRIGQIASVVAILVMIPATYTFFNVWQESVFQKQAKDFLTENVRPYKFSGNGFFLENYVTIDYNKGVDPRLELVYMGEQIPDNVVETWRSQMENYPALKNTDLIIKGGDDGDTEDKFQYVNELYETKKQEIANKEQQIAVLEQEVERLRRYAYNDVPFEDISQEIKINFDRISELGFANEIVTNFAKTDTIPVFFVKWKGNVSNKQKKADMEKLAAWLKVRTKNDSIRTRAFN
ncbi:DUF389 domain-containing protein [Robertkochia aurantiaca]|uniref:DUF389 domain-containing protein n=1 Tax=Robertkochia aurantiaca TaxID=2873700 RepID=UPI001CD02DAB|nr:DUF389 domain-containing protein [Robertkochia sp. 3YJGBD-33]